ncbi:hypothetical protein DRO61_06180 [Candidatus Bathyarchaeota archaeon]|nr:MAG: hypothetical protein DRO61_06180 [Candidatus Bathyarchaeota archaeon]
MKGRHLTVVVIGITAVLLILYDIFALIYFGVDSTISVVINDWGFQAHPLFVFCFGMVIGGLIVHFFKWKPNNKLEE